MSQPTAYPLAWPEGWKRTAGTARKHPKFTSKGSAITIADACDRVFDELEYLKASDIVISTNIEPTITGRPKGGRIAPLDPGVAIYWTTKRGPACMAIDAYETVVGNIAAVGITLAYMRGVERHGGGEILDRIFTGFAQLPPPTSDAWWNVLGVTRNASHDVIRSAFRSKLKICHPDVGGSSEELDRVQRAWEEACRERPV